MVGTPADLQRQLLGFCKAGRSLTKSEMQEVEALAECVKQLLERRGRALVAASQGLPLLYSYQCDASPVTIAAQVAGSSRTGAVGPRKGRQMVEYLMQRAILKRGAEGHWDMAALLHDPVPLTKGKRARNLFSAACSFSPLLRQLGHRGVAIQHFVGDRGVFSALNRLLLQRVQAYYDPRFGPDLGPSRALLGLTDWSLGTACSLHDAQNALKWSLAPHSAGGTLDNLHIAVESVRNTYVPLHSHIGGFLLGHLRFAEAEHDVDDAACVWRYVGVEAHVVQLLSELNPDWKGRIPVCFPER